jgi:chromosome segregation ATPase
MSKATWDEEVEFEEKEEAPSNEMVVNPEAEEDKVEYDVTENDDKEEAGAEDVNAEEVEKIKQKIKAYDKLRRQNFAQLEQLRRLKAERDHFQTKALEQYETNLNHNEGLLDNKLKIAKAKLEIAVDSNDSSSIAEANAEIATVTGEIRDLNKHRQEWNFSKEQEKQQLNQEAEESKRSNDQNINWLQSNPEFNPQNPSYNKKLYREFINHAKEVDEDLAERGEAYKIGTQEYYDYFENLMDNYRASNRGQTRSSSKPSYNPVAPISRGNTSGSARMGKGKNTVSISTEEARINKLWGITPKEHVEFTKNWKDKDFEMEY